MRKLRKGSFEPLEDVEALVDVKHGGSASPTVQVVELKKGLLTQWSKEGTLLSLSHFEAAAGMAHSPLF